MARGLHTNPHRVGWPPIPHCLKSRTGVGEPKGFTDGPPVLVQPLHAMPVLRHVDAPHPQYLISHDALLYTVLSHLPGPPEFGCCLSTPTLSEGPFFPQILKTPLTLHYRILIGGTPHERLSAHRAEILRNDPRWSVIIGMAVQPLMERVVNTFRNGWSTSIVICTRRDGHGS